MNILIDAKEYNKEEFGKSFDFLLQLGLLEVVDYLKQYKVNFVGEVITPFHHFISLPKNFNATSEINVNLVIAILKEFKNLKKNGKTLLKNKSYVFGNEINSRFFYWKRLYNYFTDYITYEFYYPKKRLFDHSIKKQKGKVNPLLTERNRDRTGLGVTYEIKNLSQNCFGNIYYSTLKKLQEEFATELEAQKINEMEHFLRFKGYEFEIILINDTEAINKFKKEQSNIVHETIAKTLLQFYQDSKIKEQYSINVFYTKEFEYVCEYLIQTALGHSLSSKPIDWIDPHHKELIPDIFTKNFIGDVKYYPISKLSDRFFEKELYAYNVAHKCSLPNLIFIPDEETKYIGWQKHEQYQLLIISLNLSDIFKDCLHKTKSVFDQTQKMVEEYWK